MPAAYESLYRADDEDDDDDDTIIIIIIIKSRADSGIYADPPDGNRHLDPDQPRFANTLNDIVRDPGSPNDQISVLIRVRIVESSSLSQNRPIRHARGYIRSSVQAAEGRQEDEEAKEEDEDEKVEEKEAGVEVTRREQAAPRRRKDFLGARSNEDGRETCVCNSAWLPSRMSDGGHAV
ncbi:hypothetical protein EAG_03235 [Camponotus floridanus]|uniref:Uncharacterized protein n=1 Tax=Camponotus floridanus TaxID=104421 RepID=E2A686_CAMFO|nr:hypothetical protein EAG_03235 [Camponotus floridanus]